MPEKAIELFGTTTQMQDREGRTLDVPTEIATRLQRPPAADAESPAVSAQKEAAPLPAAGPFQSLMAARDQQKAALDTQARIEGEALRGVASSMERLAATNQELADQFGQFHVDLVKNAEMSIAAMEKERRELAKFRVDPHRYFKNQSTFQRIIGVISAGIGGLLSAQQGGRNPVLEAMEREIDRDIRAQEAEYEARKGALMQADNLFARNMQIWGVRSAAITQTAAMQREAVKDWIAAQEMRMQSDEKRALAQMAAAQIDEKNALDGQREVDRLIARGIDAAELEIKMMDAQTRRMQARTSQYEAQTGRMGLQLRAQKQAEAEGGGLPVIWGDQVLGALPDTPAYRQNWKVLTHPQTGIVPNYDLMRSMMLRAEKLQDELGREFPIGDNTFINDPRYSELRGIYNGMFAKYAFATGGKALTDTEEKILRGTMEEPTKWFSADAQLTWKQMKKSMDDSFIYSLRASGIDGSPAVRYYQAIDRGYGRTPAEGIDPTRRPAPVKGGAAPARAPAKATPSTEDIGRGAEEQLGGRRRPKSPPPAPAQPTTIPLVEGSYKPSGTRF